MIVRRVAHVLPLLLVAATAVALVPKTPLRVLGPLTVALLVGVVAQPLLRRVPRESVVWLSREVLRAGVVLVGVRLDWLLLARAGVAPLVVAIAAVTVGMVVTFVVLGRFVGVPAADAPRSSRSDRACAVRPRSPPRSRSSAPMTER